MTTAIFSLQAMSLALPHIPGHPNRMPFSGTLTRVGVASDSAPGGSGGRRVLITPEAAERALPSLMGMAVNLTTTLDGHAPTQKIGFIHKAEVVDTELRVEGFVYAADFPKEALRIHLEQSQLGMSFEARNISAADAEADPVVISDLFFTGAAILMKNKAAYKTTRLAALAAMKHESEDDMDPEAIKAAMTEVIAGAIAPVNSALAALQAQQTALETRVGKFGDQFEAQAALVAKVEPAAASLEKTAQAMEAAGIGTDAEIGQAAVLRRMAATMRIEAAAGRVPQAYQVPMAPAHQSSQPQSIRSVELPKFEDSDAYKAMQVQVGKLTEQLTAAADKQAATETRLADLKAAQDLNKPAPDRKTLPPIISSLVAKAGLDLPDDGQAMPTHKLNQVLASSGLSMEQRMTLKTGLAKAGLVNLNTAQ
jgi:hypothetical protein